MSISTARLRRQIGRLLADFPTESDALARRAFWRVAAQFTPQLAVDRDGMRFYVNTDDQTIGRRLFVYHRTPELDIAHAFTVLRALPGVAERLEGRSVVEIGANIGSHTVELLKRYGAGAVVAIEPNPGNCELIRQNIAANDVADRVQLLPIALSDHDGVVQLEISSNNSGDHRVRVPVAAPTGPEASRPTIEVRAARFDSLVDDGQLDLATTGLIWMDAQGHEGHILRGAGYLMGSTIPIMMEYWPYGLRRAGGLELLHALIAEHYSHVIDVSPPVGESPRVFPADQLPQLESEYGWSQAEDDMSPGTDLILTSEIDAGLRFSGL